MLRLLPRGQALNSAPAMIAVEQGLVALVKSKRSYGRSIVALGFPGEIVPTVGCDVVMLAKSEIRTHLEPMEAAGELAWALRSARIAYEWVARDRLEAAARVAHLISEFAERGRCSLSKVVLPTQSEIGEMTGQTSVNVNRVLHVMERDGLIKRDDPRVVEMLDPAEIRRMAGFDRAYLNLAIGDQCAN